MIDLTPLDVRKKKGDFRKKPLGGYDIEEVDNFLDLVEERLEELVRENLSLTERLSLTEGRLEKLEGRESAVQEALVSAQELRREVQDQTLKDAEVLEEQSRRDIQLFRKEAELEIEGRFVEAQNLLKERQVALEELERNRQKFLKAFRNLLERELDAVEVEEARRPLEDAPMDLQLRGWRRDEDSEEEGAGGWGQEPLWLSSLLNKENGDTPPPDASGQEVDGDDEAPVEDEESHEPLGEDADSDDGDDSEKED